MIYLSEFFEIVEIFDGFVHSPYQDSNWTDTTGKLLEFDSYNELGITTIGQIQEILKMSKKML